MAPAATSTGYRGRERRAQTDGGPALRPWWYVGAGLVMIPLLALGLVQDARRLVDATVALPSLRTATTVLAVVVVGTAAAHWRATGRAHGLHVAVASSLLVVQSVVDLASPAPTGSLTALTFSMHLMAAGWVARAVTGPEVDSSLRLPKQLALAATMAILLTFVTGTLGPAVLDTVGRPVLVVAWAGVGVVGLVRTLHRGWQLMGWVSWAAVAIGIGEAVRLWPSRDLLGDLVSSTMIASGLLIAAIGGCFVLAQVAISRRGDLHGLFLDARRGRQDADEQRHEFVHELRNAVLVVEGAASTLERLGDHLAPDQRHQVEQALRSGIADLRDLVAAPQPVADEVFALDELVRDRVSAAEVRGLRVVVRAPGRVDVVGRRALVGRAIDNLLVNAERHGRAGGHDRPVRVDVEESVAQAVVRVEDDGPGVPRGERDAIFASGYQVDPGSVGDGVGLHVARSAVRAQRGDLVYEDGRAGGACFVLSLPLASGVLEVAGSPRADELHDGG